MSEDNPRVFRKLDDGKDLTVKICTCAECDNEFYVPAVSEDWTPNFCPYCGVKFEGMEIR